MTPRHETRRRVEIAASRRQKTADLDVFPEEGLGATGGEEDEGGFLDAHRFSSVGFRLSPHLALTDLRPRQEIKGWMCSPSCKN